MAEENHRSPGILVVDDEISVANAVVLMLKTISEDVVAVNSAKSAVEICCVRSFDLVISDMRMPEMNGAQLLELLAHDYPSMRRIILTGYADIDETMSAINIGRVHRFLTKPLKMAELVESVREELKNTEKERSEITRLRQVIDQLTDPK